MDNSMDIDVPSQDTLKNVTPEIVDNVNITDNTEKPEQPDDDDEFDDDNMDFLNDMNEEEIQTIMSPQPQQTINLSSNVTATNLNFTTPKKNTNLNSNVNSTPINSQFSSSSPLNSQFSNSTPLNSHYTHIINPKISIEDEEFLMNLHKYYNYFFPIKLYYKWLSYGNVNPQYFPHREFSFTIHPEVYLRFQSFKNEKDLKESLLKQRPKKIDIGAVYSANPMNRKGVLGGAAKPIEKELVFDIDMTDYDDIRTCCSGAEICNKCWTFMTISIKIIDRALREDFGFNHILWVYSGRRGVHCWVCDARARKLSEPARKAIVSYLEIVKGGEQQSKKVNLPNVLHPSLERAYEIVKQYFPKLILEDMNILGEKEYCNNLLSIISDEEIRNSISKKLETSESSPRNKWEELIKELKSKSSSKKSKYMYTNFERDTIFQYTYPRLDFNVSLKLNHLLKSPFCIHPGTGNVCVPIDPEDCDNFDPLSVPKLEELIEKLNEFKNQDGDLSSKDLLEETSLAPYIKQFSDFVKSFDDEISKERKIKKEMNEMNLSW